MIKRIRLFFTNRKEYAFEVLASDIRAEISKRKRQHREYKSLERQLKMLRYVVLAGVLPKE